MKKLIAFALFVAACNGTPPPVASGACRIMTYSGDKVASQECTFEGYVWTCTSSGNTTTCARGAQSSAEAPK